MPFELGRPYDHQRCFAERRQSAEGHPGEMVADAELSCWTSDTGRRGRRAADGIRHIASAASAGATVLCASSDYEQLAAISDRVLIFAQGASSRP